MSSKMHQIFKCLLITLFCHSLLGAKQSKSPKIVGIELSQAGEGLSHKVIVESAGNFRLAFENGLNYGLSQWFDLKHDPEALIDLTDNATSYIPYHEQGALFNQCLNPDDLIAHVAGAKNQFKDVPRSIKILEAGPVRVVLENAHHPMLGKKNEQILFKTRYTIYPNGKIFISNTFSASADQQITMWRNSIVGLSDPTYKVHTESGEMTIVENNKVVDKDKKWKVNQWKGLQLNLPDWRSFDILSNTENTLVLGKQVAGGLKDMKGSKYKIDSNPLKFGWLRGDSVAFPKQWHQNTAKYIYAYWDPQTPEPFKKWSTASIMLVPSPANEKQGFGLGIHGWKGFKRMYYEYGAFLLKKNESITQDYLMVLGSNKSKNLPDLRSAEITAKEAAMYASTNSGGLNAASGTYPIILKKGKNKFISKDNTCPQIFEVHSKESIALRVDGKTLRNGRDYLIQSSFSGTQVILLNHSFKSYKTLIFSEK